MFKKGAGYKTYIIGIASLIYAGAGYYFFNLDGVTAFQIVQVALASMGIRAAL